MASVNCLQTEFHIHDRISYNNNMGGYIIVGIIALLVATQLTVIVYGKWRRKRLRYEQLRALLEAFVVFNEGWTLDEERPYGWPAAVGNLNGRRLLIEGFGEYPDIALRVQFAVTVPSFVWLKLIPREDWQMDPLAYEPSFEQLFLVKQRPDGWLEALLQTQPLLPFKIEGALEPLFAEMGLLPSFLELDGEGRLLTLQHVKLDLTVNELQTAVNMMITLADEIERTEFYGE